jgi:predicted RNase H-like HicB family nuclease
MKKEEQSAMTTLECVITQEDEIYCSLCIELNVASEGTTIAEAKQNLLEAVKDYIDLALNNHIQISRPVPLEDNPFLNGDEIIEKFMIPLNMNIMEYA